jgi:hypothetical protein
MDVSVGAAAEQDQESEAEETERLGRQILQVAVVEP